MKFSHGLKTTEAPVSFEAILERYKHIDIQTVKNATHLMLVGTTNLESIHKDAIEHSAQVSVYDIGTVFSKALFIVKGQSVWLILEPIPESNDLDSKAFSQSADSIIFDALIEKMIESEVDGSINVDIQFFLCFLKVYYSALAKVKGVSIETINIRKFVNSKSLVLSNFEKFVQGQYITVGNHINHFSEIYYYIAQAIENQFGNRRISLHDLATNTGLMPYVFNHIDKSDTVDIRFSSITASDYDESSAQYMIGNAVKLDDEGAISIEIEHCDLTRHFNLIENYDVVTAIDVLEHFEDRVSHSIFRNIWDSVSNILIIHVPFEEQASTQYGHYTTFNVKKLQAWAAELPNCKDLTGMFSNIAGDKNLIEMGFLILKKANRAIGQ